MPTFAKKAILTFPNTDAFYQGSNPAMDTSVDDFIRTRKEAGLTDGVATKDPGTLTLTRVWLDQASAEEYIAFATNNSTTYSVSMNTQIVDNT